jgi:hypothetical protein
MIFAAHTELVVGTMAEIRIAIIPVRVAMEW